MSAIAPRVALQALVLLLVAAVGAAIHRTQVEEAPEVVLRGEPGGAAAPVETPIEGDASFPPNTPADAESTGGTPALPPGETSDGVSVIHTLTPERAFELNNSEFVQFVDARNPPDYAQGHLPGAINLPFGEFGSGRPAGLDELVPEATIIVYCEGGECESSRLVAQQLLMMGFPNIKIIEVGYPGWVAAGLPVEPGAAGGNP